MAKNYYLILGLTADANREDIQAAYGRRATELHPDHSGLERGPFQAVQEAYSVLSDPGRRRRFDREYRPLAARRAGSGSVPESPVASPRERETFGPTEPARGFGELSLTDSFQTYRPSLDELLERLWRNFEAISRPKSETVKGLTIEVVLGPEEARWGGRVCVRIPARVTCQACGGQGAVGPYECWQCEGHGQLTGECPVAVTYPAGLIDGYIVRIPLTHLGIENLYLAVLFRVS